MGIHWGFSPPNDDAPASARTYALRAFRLRLPFDPEADKNSAGALPGLGATIDGRAMAAGIRRGRLALVRGQGQMRLLLAPAEDDVDALARHLDRYADLRQRLTVTTPEAIRRLLLASGAQWLLDDAVSRLPRLDPLFSARRLVTAGQLVALALLAVLVVVSIALAGWTMLAVADLLCGVLFLAIVLMRVMALSGVLDRTGRPAPPVEIDRSNLPIYSILLPLYDEPHMVPDLVRSMLRLDWPRDRLDIKFLIEARDQATAAVIDALRLDAPFETIIVPEGGPRTKPKALAFALPLVRGEFVTVYDAEDQPDPGQLLEAFAAFSQADSRLACVQAPLLIENADTNALTGLFAMEYSVQFDALLPLLSALRMPLPLGGTSNHFRREALEEAGGWDPYNVTEDADLGIRLARFGYRAATITRPTYEEAPVTSRQWLSQRTRWLKGWMQTFLVHMRQPVRLWREIGGRCCLGFFLTSFGALAAAAIYPAYFITVVAVILDPAKLWRANNPIAAAMLFMNLFNFVFGYFMFALLARASLALRGRRPPPGALIFLPIYWLLQSLACYRAMIQLIAAPHHWAKTAHLGRRRSRAPSSRSFDNGPATAPAE